MLTRMRTLHGWRLIHPARSIQYEDLAAPTIVAARLERLPQGAHDHLFLGRLVLEDGRVFARKHLGHSALEQPDVADDALDQLDGIHWAHENAVRVTL